jgi:hypothetical protein
MVKSSNTRKNTQFSIDKGLIALFLKMSPQERLQANDNALRTIAELRNAFKQQQASRRSNRSA